jgi:hypothetical protein
MSRGADGLSRRVVRVRDDFVNEGVLRNVLQQDRAISTRACANLPVLALHTAPGARDGRVDALRAAMQTSLTPALVHSSLAVLQESGVLDDVRASGSSVAFRFALNSFLELRPSRGCHIPRLLLTRTPWRSLRASDQGVLLALVVLAGGDWFESGAGDFGSELLDWVPSGWDVVYETHTTRSRTDEYECGRVRRCGHVDLRALANVTGYPPDTVRRALGRLDRARGGCFIELLRWETGEYRIHLPSDVWFNPQHCQPVEDRELR